MNEEYKFTIDKLVSIKKIIKSIEETNYIDGYLGYEDGFYIDSILYYLKENARLKEIENKLIFIKNRVKQGMPQENINKCAIELVNSYLKEN